MVHLRVLGRAVVERDGDLVRGRATQSHHLALLSFLAAAPGRTAGRERIIGCLWPDSDTARARHRLSVALHAIRGGLGEDSLVTSGDAVALNPSVVQSDVGDFLDAVGAGKLEDAARLYAGPFLEGFYLKGGLDFERWADDERNRLARLYRSALDRLAEEAETTGQHRAALEWRSRLASLAPYEASVAIGLAKVMAANGDLAGALAHLRSHATRVEVEMGFAPHPDVLALAEALAVAGSERQRDEAAAVELVLPQPDDPPSAPPEPLSVLAPPPMPRARPRRRLVTMMAGGLMAVGSVWVLALAGAPEVPAGTLRVAVLPFESIGGDEAEFGERLAEEIGATLAIVPNLGVESTPDGARALGIAGLRRLGRELGVTRVVVGDSRLEGNRAEITARLVDTESEEVLWEATIERELRSQDALVEALSMAVADSLRTRLARYVPHHYTDSESANEAFLEGVYSQRRFNPEDMWVALQHYRRGWEEDPGFALAHAIAGSAYMGLSHNFGLGPDVGWERGREHVLQAIAIDPTLPEAYSVLGRLQLWWDRDFEAAERTLRRAIMLYPTHPDARTWYAFYQLYYLRDLEGAVASIRHALEVDPLNTARSRDVEIVLYQARRFEQLPAQAAHTWSLNRELAASFSGSRLATAYREMGMYEEAIAEYHALQERRNSATPTGLGVTYARMGRLDDARAVLRERLEGLGPGASPGVSMAQLGAAVGETDLAFEILEQVYSRNPAGLFSLATDPAYDPLRGDPRFEDLLARMGLAG